MITAEAPAIIMGQWLTDVLLGSKVETGGLWPVFVSSMPDKPNNCISVEDTNPNLEGRFMRTGQTVRHYGVQIVVRSETYPIGHLKMRAIDEAVDKILQDLVTTDQGTFRIDNASHFSGIISIGPEPGTTRRELFSLNLLLTISEL